MNKSNSAHLMIILIVFLSTILKLSSQSEYCTDNTKTSFYIHMNFSRMTSETIAQKLDSLYSITDTTCSKAMIYLNTVKGRHIKKSGQLDSALHYYNIAQYHADKINYVKEQKNIANLKSTILSTEDKYNDAIDLLRKAINIPCHPDSLSCLKTSVKLMLNAAVNLRFVDKYEEAIQQFDTVRILMDKWNIQDSIWKVVIYNGMGTIYEMELDDDRSAVVSFKNALKHCPHNHPARFSLQNNIGNAYFELNEIDSSIFYLNLTISNTTIPKYLINANTGLGDISFKNKEYDNAIKAYEKALKYGETAGNIRLTNHVKSLLCRTYYEKGEYRKAKKLVDSVLSLYESKDNYLNKTEFHKIKRLQLLCQAQIMDRSYGKDLDLHLTKIDSINDAERVEKLNSSIARFEKKITEDSLRITKYELDQAHLQASNQRLGITSLAFGLMAALLLITFLYRSYKKQQVRNEALVFKQNELNIINTSLTKRLSQLTLEHRTKPVENITQIEVPVLNRKYIVRTELVTHLKAENNGCRIYMEDQSIWTELSLKQVSLRLPATIFVKIFRSTTVNINFIEWVNHASLKLTSGEELKIGRSYKSEILSRFN